MPFLRRREVFRQQYLNVRCCLKLPLSKGKFLPNLEQDLTVFAPFDVAPAFGETLLVLQLCF